MEDPMGARIHNTAIHLTRGDITDVTADAIVNAANEHLIPGSGVAGAIHRVGGPEIERESRSLPGSPKCPTGHAVATGAGRLHAHHVIHAVAPVWRGGRHGEPDLLASAYRRSLELADELGDHTIAFPSLGTGVFGYPIGAAASIALGTVASYLRGETRIISVLFILFSRDDLAVYEHTLREVLGGTPHET
jgi:O-acetyl-ADP-ribose deacetylase